jgi:hypothetical protein
MKVAIVGSRNWPDKKAVVNYVKKLPKGTIVVSGGATGPDSWAEESAKARGLETMIFKPEWEKWGKSAGFRRNTDIVLSSDRVVAFTTGSKGTEHSIMLAKRYGKPVEIIRGETAPKQDQKMLFKDMEIRNG